MCNKPLTNSKNNSTKINQKTIQNQCKIDPEAFPNACLKISRKITSTKRQSVNLGVQIGRWEGGKRSHFLSIFCPRGTLGGQNGPKTPPESFWDPSRPQFSMKFDGFSLIFLMILVRFSVIFCTLVFSYFVKTVGSQSRKLPSRQGFRQYF